MRGQEQELIVVIGKARTGKTTFANHLAEGLGVKAAGTSDVVYEAMAKARNCTVEDLNNIPKEELRPQLITFADFLCSLYPSVLSEGLIRQGVVIIEGIRRVEELIELSMNHLVTHVYYMERDAAIDDNFSIEKAESDHIIENNGSLEDLKKTAIRETRFLQEQFNYE
jgi:dephospho-CoA kinase